MPEPWEQNLSAIGKRISGTLSLIRGAVFLIIVLFEMTAGHPVSEILCEKFHTCTDELQKL